MDRLGARPCYVVLLVLFLAIGGCGDSTGLDREALDLVALDVVADGERIAITNRTREPVFIFVIGRHLAALTLWGPCVVVAPGCEPLAPGETRFEPYPSHDIPAVETEAIVYWWRAVPTLGGRRSYDRIRPVVVTL
jgi:hypothetical protein